MIKKYNLITDKACGVYELFIYFAIISLWLVELKVSESVDVLKVSRLSKFDSESRTEVIEVNFVLG